MQGTVTCDGADADATRAVVEEHLAKGTFFWLDLDGVDDEARDLLLDGFKIHHLAVDDAQHFGQRPKVEDYDDFIYLVVHGALRRTAPTEEVHFILADHFVVTVHRGPCPAMDEVRQAGRPPEGLRGRIAPTSP